MGTKQLQTWLKNRGYYKGNIDGIAGRQTREALRKAQTHLKDLGLYDKDIDGGVNSGTNGIHLITKFNKLGGLLQYCQSGSGLKGRKKASDKTDESQNVYKNSGSEKLDKDKVYVVNMFYNSRPEKNDLFNMVKSFFDLEQLGLLKYISNI